MGAEFGGAVFWGITFLRELGSWRPEEGHFLTAKERYHGTLSLLCKQFAFFLKFQLHEEASTAS